MPRVRDDGSGSSGWGWPSDLDTVSLQPAGFLCLGVDDFNKLWLEGGSAHKETVNVLLGSQLFAGSAGHRT